MMSEDPFTLAFGAVHILMGSAGICVVWISALRYWVHQHVGLPKWGSEGIGNPNETAHSVLIVLIRSVQEDSLAVVSYFSSFSCVTAQQ